MSTSTRANLVEKVEEMTQKHKVVVFAKTYCPYCAQVRLMANRNSGHTSPDSLTSIKLRPPLAGERAVQGPSGGLSDLQSG